jgi:excisionase family DNA binding protein
MTGKASKRATTAAAGRRGAGTGSGKGQRPGPARDERRWYTVREAAEHLGVSQPTIFRWMKEGLLSFYKIGGSTRFTREGLDSVVEKTTGLREAEAVQARCAACGHGVLVEGRLQGTGRLYFRPEKTKFWVFTDSMVGLQARVCAACGFVQVHADTSKLRRLKQGEGE